MRKIKHIIGSVCRTILALVFLFSGFVKAVDPLGTVYKVQDYLQEGFGGWLHWALPLAGAAAVALICLELLLGACMILNVRTRWTSVITLIFYLVMTPVTLYIAIANPVSDCGCFGDALVITNWQTFWKNVLLLILAVNLVICRKSVPDTFSAWAEACIAVLALACAAGIMGYSYTHLPIIDFRPYKIGNHIPTLMEGGKAPVYEYTYIYEKDGVQQQFGVDNCPSKEDGWKYVDRIDVLVQEGEEAPIHDFQIMIKEETEYADEKIWVDLTDDILYSEEPVTLVTMYDLKKTDRRQLEKVKALLDSDAVCYIITGSGEDEITAFAQETGLDEQAFCFMDPIAIKTIVRANPGAVVIKDGTVIEKYNFRNR